MKQSKNDKLKLKNLGKISKIANEPSITILEKVKNPHDDVNYLARFSCPEFTSLCPVTGQPDFAHLVIEYVPDNFLVESKSLKLYLFSYRNHDGFHEDCTVQIAKDICKLIKPKFFRIGGYWYPRGGIPIDVFYQYGKTPKDMWLPEQGVPNYKGRG